MYTCVAGGGFLCTLDFLTSLQSQGHLLAPVCSPFMCAMNPCLACTPELILDSILRLYCRENQFQHPLIYSSWYHCFTRTAHPFSCPGRLSLNYPSAVRTGANLPLSPTSSVCQPFYSVSSFVTFPQPLTVEHLHNFRLTCRCHGVFLFCATAPFAPVRKVQTLTAVVCLPILTTKLCFERSSGHIT
jgi:hypothetical protein